MNAPLLVVEELRKYFPIRESFLTKQQRWVKAVDGVDLKINPQETFGLVGESGCGKTTFARTILRLMEPTNGRVYFKGKNVYEMSPSELKEFRLKAQIVFQDPFSSLDPRMTIEQIISEPFTAHGLLSKKERREAVLDIIQRVGLKGKDLRKYPHEFSGGQRQRVAIARALVLQPEFVVLDEPTSALDVSVQSQILNLLMDLKKDLNITYLFISHDLGLVRYLCDRVGIMYLGKIVEMGGAEEIFQSPDHPYSKALISAIPSTDPEQHKKRIILKGEVPSPVNPPSGCRFHPRCPYTMPICKKKEPKLTSLDQKRSVACHLYF